MSSSPVLVGTVDWAEPEPTPEIKHSCGAPMLAVGGARFTENVGGIIYACLKCHTMFLRGEKEVIPLGDMSDEFVSALVAGELEEKKIAGVAAISGNYVVWPPNPRKIP